MTSPPPVRPRAVWDLVVSIVLLAVALVAAYIAVVGQFFFLASTDYCPPATCHIDEGVNRVIVVWVIMAVILVAATVVTIIFLVKRRRAWWVALVALLAMILGGIIGVTLYISAVS